MVRRYPIREEAVHMLLEQVYLLFIYILFIELAIVTVVAIALFVALVVTIYNYYMKNKLKSQLFFKNYDV